MKTRLAMFALVGIWFLTGCAAHGQRVGESSPETPELTRKAEVFDLQAHRGGKGRVPPGNILQAFEYAMDLQVTTMELDMHSTKDGVVVVIHDARVPPEWRIDRDAPGPRPPDPRSATAEELLVKRLTLAQLKKYRCELPANLNELPGRDPNVKLLVNTEYGRISTLEEVFEFCRDYSASEDKTDAQRENAKNIRFNLETKARGFEKQLIDIVKKFGLQDRVTVQSFDHGAIVVVSEIDPGICTAALNGLPSRIVQETKADIWSHNHAGVTPAKVKTAHDLGLLVIPWTVNETARMNTLIDWGVDGIITDYPDILKDILNERGIPYAPPLK
jgi:glycerophosphoryl diester phosphodiesterase